MNQASVDAIPCPLVERLPVLGVEVTFETNAPSVHALVRETYGWWASLREQQQVVTSSRAVVRIVVDPDVRVAPGRSGATDRTTFRIEEADGTHAESARGSGTADTRNLRSCAHVSPALVARGNEFVERWLEPLTLFLLGALDREPLHAAAVVRGGVAIVLAGPSGAGKSTLAYAAVRDGFAVLADEPVYVQMRPRLRVWGRRARLHLNTDAAGLFPELAGRAPRRLVTGKTKIVVDGSPHVPYAERAVLCLIDPEPVPRAGLERLAPERAVAELTAHLDPGYALFTDTIGARIARLAKGGAWRLRRTRAPADAVPLLRALTDRAVGAA